jgi:hypothetical protein
MKIKLSFIIISVFILVSCDMDIAPFDGVTKENLSEVPGGLKFATNGAYSLMKDQLKYKGAYDFRSTYARNLHQMLEFPGDNVTLSGTTSDPLFFATTRQHYPTMENATYVWYVAYKIINTANQNIESAVEGKSVANDNLIGENYFLRAMAHFDLLRLFAKPYSHGTENKGVVLRLNSADPDNMARATVGACYTQVEQDFLKAAELLALGTRRGVEYGSKEAAWAMLSRLYLYMEKNDKAIEFATKVIESPLVSLEPKTSYLNLFWNSYTSKESIFVMKHVLQDDRGFGSIGSMYNTDRGIGWGEVFASEPLRNILDDHPEDVRNTLIKPQYKANGIDLETRNGIPKYFVTKHSYQDDVVSLSSPHVIRLGEVYLNRAEAYAKIGEDQKALDDANVIRARAGISGTGLYALGKLQGTASVLAAVLQERRLELAYEGHRAIDVYRNKLSMDRNFPGVQPKEVIDWNNARNIYYVPQDELAVNLLAKQND